MQQKYPFKLWTKKYTLIIRLSTQLKNLSNVSFLIESISIFCLSRTIYVYKSDLIKLYKIFGACCWMRFAEYPKEILSDCFLCMIFPPLLTQILSDTYICDNMHVKHECSHSFLVVVVLVIIIACYVQWYQFWRLSINMVDQN